MISSQTDRALNVCLMLSTVLKKKYKKNLFIHAEFLNTIFFMFMLQTLEFDREGLTKLKKAAKAIHNSGNSKKTIFNTYVIYY